MCKQFSSPFDKCPTAKASYTTTPRISAGPNYTEARIWEGEL